MAKAHPAAEWGEYLAKLRKGAGLSGGQAATRLAELGIHVDRRTIYAYEAGRIVAPDAVALWGLCKLYSVDVDQVIAALARCRAGESVRVGLPAKEQAPVHLTAAERDLIRSLRRLSSARRERVRSFIEFESQNRRATERTRHTDRRS